MKLSIYSILIATMLFMMGCNVSHEHGADSRQEIHHHKKESEHTHTEGDEHPREANEASEKHPNEIAFSAEQAKAAGLETENIQASSFRHVIKTGGQIQAPQGDEQTIVATSAGVVSFANSSIADGTPVRLGETIVTLSAKNLQDGDPVMKAKILYETAEKEFKRAEGLAQDKIISDKEFEQVKMRYETAKAAYMGQSANFTTSGVKVTSPMGGYVKNRWVNQGDYVSVGEPIVTLARDRRLQLRAEVSENYYAQLKNVHNAHFRTAYNETIYKLENMNGELLSYGRTSNSNSSYIPVTFEFDNVGDLIPGAYAEVFLLASPRENVISVPMEALTEEQGLYFVYIQVEPDAFVKKEVRIGQNNGERVEILSGLHGGEKVVTKGVTQVKLAAASGAIPEGHTH